MFFSYHHILWATLIQLKLSLGKNRITWVIICLADMFYTRPTQCRAWRKEVDGAADHYVNIIPCWACCVYYQTATNPVGVCFSFVPFPIPYFQSLGTAPMSPGGTQAWSCFHGDETCPRFTFHFILYLSDIIKKWYHPRLEDFGKGVPLIWGRSYRRDSGSFCLREGGGIGLAKKRLEFPQRRLVWICCV